MNVNDIARVAHDVDKAYCESLGDYSNKSWFKASPERRAVVVAGVRSYLADHKATAASMHNTWVVAMIDRGWVHGEEEDPIKKTHPCIVPFSMLSPTAQAKDYIFHAVVLALMQHHDDYVYLGEDN